MLLQFLIYLNDSMLNFYYFLVTFKLSSRDNILTMKHSFSYKPFFSFSIKKKSIMKLNTAKSSLEYSLEVVEQIDVCLTVIKS